MHKRSCDVQGLCDGFLQTQRCGAWVELLFSIPTFFVFLRETPKTRLQWWCYGGEKKKKCTIQLFIDTELFDTLGCIVRSYRFPVVSPLFLNADPRKKCPHHLLLHCSLCRENTVWAVQRKSLFDKEPTAHWLQEQTAPFESPGVKLKGTSPKLHGLWLNRTTQSQLICTGHTLYLLSHTLFNYCHQRECFCTYCCALIVCCDCAKCPAWRFPETLRFVSFPVMQWKKQ